jgi:hypothetical protein
MRGTGRGRRTAEQECISIALAAGILDSLLERGTCYAHQLTIAKRVRLGEEVDCSNLQTRLLSGRPETIAILEKIGAPATLLLFIFARFAEVGGSLEPVDEASGKSKHLQSGSYTSHVLAAQQIEQDREDNLLKHQKDRSLNPDRVSGEDGSQSLVCRLHRIPELRTCGLSKQTISKWRKDPRSKEIYKQVVKAFGQPNLMNEKSPMFRNYKVESLLNGIRH